VSVAFDQARFDTTWAAESDVDRDVVDAGGYAMWDPAADPETR